MELGRLQLPHDGLEDRGAKSLLQVFETVFQGLGHQDHKAQVVGQLQTGHLESKTCTLSVFLPQLSPGSYPLCPEAGLQSAATVCTISTSSNQS